MSDGHRCPVCFSDAATKIGQHASSENGINYSLYECENCRLGYCDPPVPAESSYYRDMEWYGERWEFQRVFAVTQLSNGSILEIGCGEGHFIRHANERRNHVVGVDFNDEVVDRCRRRGLDADVVCLDYDRMKDFSCFQKPFDMVVFFHLIEHIENIHEFLGCCRKALAENGFLVFSTPDRSRANVYFRRRETWDYPPHHLTWWGETAAREVLQRSGFELCHLENEPLYFRDIHRNVVSSTLELLPKTIQGNAWCFRAAYYLMFSRSALLYLSNIVSRTISGNTLLVIARLGPESVGPKA